VTGGAKVPTAYKPVVKPTLSGGGYVPTAYKPAAKPISNKPIATRKPLIKLSDSDPDVADQ
jgi:hypothetical protein